MAVRLDNEDINGGSAANLKPHITLALKHFRDSNNSLITKANILISFNYSHVSTSNTMTPVKLFFIEFNVR